MKNLTTSTKKVNALLQQAKSLADTLSIAFDTKSGVPEGNIMLNPKPKLVNSGRNSLAGMGTLVLEWTRLSDLTGDPKYAKLAQKAESYLIKPTGSPEAFPGLVGSSISTDTGEFVNSRGGWGGGSDSFYEYLIKMYLYDPKQFASYKDRWVLAVDSSIKNLKSHPSTRKDLTFFSEYNGQKVLRQSGHCTYISRWFPCSCDSPS